MSDYIEREAVLNLARSGQLIANCNFRKVCKLIEDIPAADVRPVWIPVADRLPEEVGKYLVCGRWRGNQAEIWICEFMTLGCLKGWANNAANPSVSHWMPLPYPPKGET